MTEGKINRKLLLNYIEEDDDRIINSVMMIMIVIMTILIGIKLFWFSPVQVIGFSMYDTINDGDILVMDKLRPYKRGDVVVLKYSESTNYIKRIIGLPGDTIYNDSIGNVYIIEKGKTEAEILDEEYAYFSKGYGTFGCSGYGIIEQGVTFRITLGDDEMFVMGDNRWGSSDSRYQLHLNKRFKTSQIIGVVPQWVIDKRYNLRWLYYVL